MILHNITIYVKLGCHNYDTFRNFRIFFESYERKRIQVYTPLNFYWINIIRKDNTQYNL